MKVLKKTAEYTIYQKRSGRHAVQGADKQWINGEDKAKILLTENLIKLSSAAEPKPAEEATAEAVTEEAAVEPVAEAAEAEAETETVASEEKPAE